MRNSRRIPLAAALFLSAPALFAPAECAEDPEESFVGRRLPALSTDQWYTHGKISVGSLRGQRWCLCLITVQATNFANHIAPLERLHRPQEEGGPVVILLCMDEDADIVRALAALPKKPSCYVARDDNNRTGQLLSSGRIPYYYFIDENGKVYYQGAPGDADFQKEFMALVGYRGPKPAEPKEEGADAGKGAGAADGQPGGAPAKLPDGFVEKCAALIKKGKTAERIRLLREAHTTPEAPQDPAVRKLWDHIQGELDAAAARCRARLERGEYQDARQQLEKIGAEFEGFPPAAGDAMRALRSEIAEKESRLWFERAEQALGGGDRKEARTLLERILKTYPEGPWAEKARKLLAELK